MDCNVRQGRQKRDLIAESSSVKQKYRTCSGKKIFYPTCNKTEIILRFTLSWLYFALFDQEDNAPRCFQLKLFQFPRLFTLKTLHDMRVLVASSFTKGWIHFRHNSIIINKEKLNLSLVRGVVVYSQIYANVYYDFAVSSSLWISRDMLVYITIYANVFCFINFLVCELDNPPLGFSSLSGSAQYRTDKSSFKL